ncbi:gustatory and odorant receptor 63a-like [Zootermopsis nevadensis]|uniref:Gustatory receptor n=1 Tax=Zootermopsis nevadensis TaxID=136037 RepID=A0A067R756_ZOONE|nr:gustatory and odorant receptor 63a-like [Zootermopsis nevadensis]KDR19186.1 hypothetical protein L798_06240 [Zootermopsis nevadensis]
MHLKRTGPQISFDLKYDHPVPIKWRQVDEASIRKDEVVIVISEAEGPSSEFFEELKPIIYTMKIFGLFPLQKRIPGEPTFRRCKFSLMYSAVFYLAMNIYAYYVSRERIQFIRYSEASFDDLMYSVIHFMYVIPHFYLIPCHWKEVSKVGRYFVHWSDFQKQYVRVTGKQLYLGQNRHVMWSVVLTPVVALCFVATEYYMSSAEEKYWELGFYWYIFTVILLHIVWWWFTCSSLRSGIYDISENLFKDPTIFADEGSATLVAQYRALWISLSRLSCETGLFMCYTYGHLCVLSFSVMTLSLYGSLSNLHDGLYLRHLGLALAVCVIGGVTYVMANGAHHAAREVGPEFCEKLSHVNSDDKQMRRELKIFTRVMTLNSSEINLGGYVRIDRGFLLRFICTMVTYLVVLLQFRLGLLSITTSNVTMVTTDVL